MGSYARTEREEIELRLTDLQEELDGLRRALRTRATIEQAMGVLIVAQRCTPQQAFRSLVRLSQQHNIKLHRVAQLLVRLAAKVETGQLEPLLNRAAANSAVLEPESATGSENEFGWPDDELIEIAKALVQATEPSAAGRAQAELHRLLVGRGWIPPYEVLADLSED